MSAWLRRLLDHLRVGRRASGGPRPFEEVLALFRAVLEDNTRALQVINRMGETLGGDYLFDSTFLRAAYAQLAAAVGESLRDFDQLTRGRHPGLAAVFARLDGAVRDVLEGRRGPDVPALLPLEGVGWELARQVGGKSAALAELRAIPAIAVPAGFALTVTAFAQFVAENGLAAEIAALGDAGGRAERLATLRARILAGRMPPALAPALEEALADLRRKGWSSLAVRSSAPEEDGEFSFAGQFESVLGVPANPGEVWEACLQVFASLYGPKAAAYHDRLGLQLREQEMAVCCLGMVDAVSSGVLYTADPAGRPDDVVVASAWGLGAAVVEGQAGADRFVVRGGPSPAIVETHLGEKPQLLQAGKQGGVTRLPTPEGLRHSLSLGTEQVLSLAAAGRLIEARLRRPLDLEWAIDRDGRVFWLQARPLRLVAAPAPVPAAVGPGAPPPLIAGRGTVVQRGVGAGRVFLLRNPEDLAAVPRNAVLVARSDSSELIRAMPAVAAIITDAGSPTSHMAALCREFRIPTVVDVGDATRVLAHGDTVTLEATEAGAAVHAGVREDLLAGAGAEAAPMERLHEFRAKRYLLRYIVPLNLVDPLRDDFTPARCRSIHDLLRFVHEKSVLALVERALEGRVLPPRGRAVRLELAVPADVVLIDIGGALDPAPARGKATIGQIASSPLRAVLAGMTRPGAWQTDAVPLRMGDFVGSMLRMPDITARGGLDLVPNLAVASRDYLNLSLRFGYHFAVLDAYCSPEAHFNHVYFRFFGGATDLGKRSRRVRFIAAVLADLGFSSRSEGDLITARLAGLGRGALEPVLDQVGRLLAYTRQLDARLVDDAALERAVREFRAGNSRPMPPAGPA